MEPIKGKLLLPESHFMNNKTGDECMKWTIPIVV